MRTLFLTTLWLALPGTANAVAVDWARASVVIAGVLEWDDPSYSDFDKADRQDEVLAKGLRKLGVPADRLELLLDAQAPHPAILASVARMAKATPPGGTLVFYFDGHGGRTSDGRIYFASSDARGADEAGTTLLMDDLAAVIEQYFRGRRVLLFADCCHSGGLADVARHLRKLGLDAIAVTSSEVSNSSTVNWTFTLALNDALFGRASFDHDRDGAIELGELTVEVKDAMLYRELQRAGLDVGDAGLDLVLAPAQREETIPRAPEGFRLGEYVKRQDDAIVRVVGLKGTVALVETLDYATRTVDKVDPKTLRRIAFERFPTGADLRVEWGGKCWDAKVVRVDGAFHWITYPGWPAYWDEWVADDRIISGAETCPAPK